MEVNQEVSKITKLYLSIITDDGRTAVVCPNKAKIKFPEGVTYTIEELAFILESSKEFIDYCDAKESP